MKTFVGMTYEQWLAHSGAKSEARKESEREAWYRNASEGMRGYEVDPITDDERN